MKLLGVCLRIKSGPAPGFGPPTSPPSPAFSRKGDKGAKTEAWVTDGT